MATATVQTQAKKLYLIETPPKNQASAAVEHPDLGPPPRQAQVVGTVSFSKSEQYTDWTGWDRDRPRHQNKPGSALDRQGSWGGKHAWRIHEVWPFPEPVPVSNHTVASLLDMASALQVGRIGDPSPDPSNLPVVIDGCPELLALVSRGAAARTWASFVAQEAKRL